MNHFMVIMTSSKLLKTSASTLAYDHCIWIYLGLVDSCGLSLVAECYEHQVGCVREYSWGCLALLQASFYIPTGSDTVINA